MELVEPHIAACSAFIAQLTTETATMEDFLKLQNTHSGIVALGQRLLPPLTLPVDEDVVDSGV